MKLLTKLYDKTLLWSQHKYAPRYLAAISFAESSFFPIPPDVMLAPMALAKPTNAYSYAFITTVFSVIGGLFGYMLGYLVFEPIVKPLLNYFGYVHLYAQAMGIFGAWGLIGVIIAAITPIPYKLFTFGAGVLQFNLIPFVIGSIIGRGGRFYLVALIMRLGGAKMQVYLRSMISTLGWLIIIIGLVIFATVKYI
jgi:membrane protein YqaA with SNARE-associated domain